MKKIETLNPENKDSIIENSVPSRNEKLLTISTIFIIPSFYIFYFLKKDLIIHENHETIFINRINNFAEKLGKPLNIQTYATASHFSSGKYILISIVTLGFASFYWLYGIFNDYNNHFKMQWIIEDQIHKFLKGLD
ncbi:MAG: hypothetical protein P8X47_11820 [Ignavibacteriaceae bacterium]